MDRGDVLSGAAFTAALYAAGVFLIVLVGTGLFANRYVHDAMIQELAEQILAEQVMLENIYRDGGTSQLVDTLDDLAGANAGRHALAVFDANGKKLAGNFEIAPDFVGWSQVPFTITHKWAPAGPDRKSETTGLFFAHSTKLDDLTVVVGRSLVPVQRTETALLRAMAASGMILVLALVGIGYVLSRASLRKLVAMEAVLAQASDGDTAARIPVSRNNDQIDRIALRMNAHLDTLSRLMATTRATAAAISHDLRSPLARAFICLGRAFDRTEAGQNPREALGDLQDDLERMRGIFDSYLTLARIESGADGARFGPVDLGPLLDDLADTYQLVAEDAGQSLAYERPEGADVTVRGNTAMLQQLVANLLENAVTHGGPDNRILLRLERRGNTVRLIVADTGPGIPEAARSAVFEAFRRLDSSRSAPGNGLGLALVRAIAERHGATITLADNAPGLRVEIAFARPPA